MDRGEWGVIIDVFVNTCGEFYTQNIYFLYTTIYYYFISEKWDRLVVKYSWPFALLNTDWTNENSNNNILQDFKRLDHINFIRKLFKQFLFSPQFVRGETAAAGSKLYPLFILIEGWDLKEGSLIPSEVLDL